MVNPSAWWWRLAVLAVISATFRYIPNCRHVSACRRSWAASLRSEGRADCLQATWEAGFQPQLLRGGWTVSGPCQHQVTIPRGRIVC